MILTKPQILEIIFRQFPDNFEPGMFEKLAKSLPDRVVLKQARRVGLEVELRNGKFIVNQKN